VNQVAEERGRLREEIRALGPWHLKVEVAPGVTTAAGRGRGPGHPTFRDPGPMARRVLADVYPGGLEGRSFLDHACNCGAYSLIARDAGAGRILAYDAREHWLRQADFLRARLAPRYDDVEFRRMGVAELGSLAPERFDVSWFSGIFYHLPNPIGALAEVAAITNELIYLCTQSSPPSAAESDPRALYVGLEDVRSPMSGVDGLKWRPSGPGLFRPLFRSLGFSGFAVVRWVESAPGQGRLTLLAARDPALTDGFRERRRSRAASSPRQQPPRPGLDT
jgi:hypothetical protein